MSEITIVTAFFDIGRTSWENSQRSNHEYMEAFKFWARIRNNVIIYTEKVFAEEIFNIRKSYGLEQRTKVITIDNVLNCDREIYDKMAAVMQSNIFRSFRKDPKSPESWNARYNYIMYLKSYFITDAINKKLTNDFVAWFDFGFNKNGTLDYPYKEEFDFLWKYDFENKMYLFVIEDIGIDKPIFDIVREMDVYITGNTVIGAKILWPQYHSLCRNSIISLADCGMADDDQTIALMAYRKKPQLFKLYKVNTWCGWLKELGGSHLTQKIFKEKKYKKYKRCALLYFKERNNTKAFFYYCKYLMGRFSK